jgi:anti-sigma-K factor RskA
MKTVFRDRHDRIDYLKACEEARRILADPTLLAAARRFLEDAMAPDANQRAHVARWREVLALPAPEVAALLVEDSDRGQSLRETRPVFGAGLTAQDVARLIAAA